MYKTIKKILTTRDAVKIKDNEDNILVIMKEITDLDNCYLIIEQEDIYAAGYKEVEEMSEDDNWQIIEVFDIPKERFKVDDEVVVQKNVDYAIKQYEKDGSEKKYIKKIKDSIGKKLKIISKFDEVDYMYDVDAGDEYYLRLPHDCLSYPWKEEKKPFIKLTVDDLKILDNKKDKQQKRLDYVIIRTELAGVHAGYLKERKGNECTLIDSRRIWYWDGAFTLNKLAKDGTTKPENCKFSCEVEEIELIGVVEVIKTTEKARKQIIEIKEHKNDK